MKRLISSFLSRDDQGQGNTLARRLRRLSYLERQEEARAFLDTHHEAIGLGAEARQKRRAEVRRELRKHGFYEHTPEELAFGARLAWRNTGRCIGRLPWESLEVVDCRHIVDPDGMADRMRDHLSEADRMGAIRSVISVFAPVRGQQRPAWIESSQITQYAGYSQPDGSILGDRQSIEATRIALSMGWQAPTERGRFDLLPYLIRDKDDRRILIEAPKEQIREVQIEHPSNASIAEMQLKWYAVPMINNMIMTIGGIDYPCAPFNGYYMCTEIASRDLADKQRYNLLPEIAEALDLNTRDPLCRDTALTELNRAVFHSYRKAGVTMIDHHTASNQFMNFHRREQLAGRRVAADWRWIVPPQASSACEVFHLKMRNFHPVPNFYRNRGSDGLRLMPWYGDGYQSRTAVWKDRVMRRWKLWKRMVW